MRAAHPRGHFWAPDELIELTPACRAQTPLELRITPLLLQLDDAGCARVCIDRTSAKCHTPRRNPAVDAALAFYAQLYAFTATLCSFFLGTLLPMQTAAAPEVKLDLGAINARGCLVPRVLFTKPADEEDDNAAAMDAPQPPAQPAPALAAALAADGASPALLDRGALNALLAQAAAELAARIAALAAALPAATSASLTSGAEAALLVAADYAREVAQAAYDGASNAEAMLRDQLTAAVGKVVGPRDFADYMRYHNRRLFRPGFEPRPFCYSVRRSDAHAPEGLLRIDEAQRQDGAPAEPIQTLVHSAAGGDVRPMSFALNAETRVTFGGTRHLHAWLDHSFAHGSGSGAFGAGTQSLVASARQFSSFIVLVGRITAADTFDASTAVIVQNKDELSIPLSCAALPTAGEFRDAIASLSGEQQRFARAIRAMQLESTLCAVLVLQIKPAMEQLLNLAPDSLTKEIELTQDLTKLFVEHQIPSDLVTYAGPDDADKATRLAAVKGHVAGLHALISKSEERIIEHHNRQLQAEATTMRRSFGDGGLFGGAAASASFALPPPPPLMGFPAACAPASASFAMAAAPQSPGFRTFGAAIPMPPPLSAVGAAPPAADNIASAGATQAAAAAQQRPAASADDMLADELEADADAGGGDLTKVPAAMDAAFERLDHDNALRPTVITPSSPWSLKQLPSLLARSTTTSTLYDDKQRDAKTAAFDLLDALSRSGALPMEHAALHVIVGATHCFDDSLLDVVCAQSVNPIEKVERSTIIMASTIHGVPPLELLRREQRARVEGHSPALFAPAADAGAMQ